MVYLFFILVVALILLFNFTQKTKITEPMCAIQHHVCDNYCQRSKLELCLHYAKDGKHPPFCN